MPSPFERCWSVGRCSWDSQNTAFPSITSSPGLFLQPHPTVLMLGLLSWEGQKSTGLLAGLKHGLLVFMFSGTCKP